MIAWWKREDSCVRVSRTIWCASFYFVMIGLAGTWPSAARAQFPIQLRDITAQTGVTFQHTDGSSGRRYIVETLASGLALFDYDNDGDTDIYFLNGAPLPGALPDTSARNRLYRNEGDWRLTDVTDVAGVGDTGYSLGVAVADYDNDGYQDVYVSNFGPNVLYHNNGDGTFSDVTGATQVAAGDAMGAGVSFLDADADGNLDLYVANYVKFSFAAHRPYIVDGFPKYPGPKSFDPEPDRFFRNNGDGTFRDASEQSGIAAHAGTGMGTIAFDCDQDGDADIVVLNDVMGNFLFENDGTGKFTEVGLLSGIGYNIDGQALGSMGVDCADYDNDGLLDLFQTSFANELPALFRNLGAGLFSDETRAAGAGVSALAHVNWGTGFADFDNDGDSDLFLANGHLQDNVELYDDKTAYEVANQLLMNDGRGKFIDVSGRCGSGLAVRRSSRGAAFDDLDRDGRIDVVVSNSRQPPTILRNESLAENHWIQIRLHAIRGNRDGVGARVTVKAGKLSQVKEVHSGRGYQSHWGTCLHFGLGGQQRVDRIEIQWLGGGRDAFADVAVDQIVEIIEGSGRTQ